MIGGVLMLGLLGASIGANLLMYLLDREEFVDSQLKIWAAYWYLFVLIILGNSFVIYAAVQMLRVRQFGACVFGAIIGLIPLITPCYFLGIPFAIWAMVILLRKDTRAAFAEAK